MQRWVTAQAPDPRVREIGFSFLGCPQLVWAEGTRKLHGMLNSFILQVR